MIHWKKKDFDNPPEKLRTPNCIKQIASAVQNRDGNEYTTTYYQDLDVLNALRAYSINKDTFDEKVDQAKCYYCESFCEEVATLQVEHYRPKTKICDENNVEIIDSHGYYWLGCEWSNLLLSCPKCNGSGAKGNKFPIKGNRHLEESPIKRISKNPDFDRTNCYANKRPLLDEQPLLLNPEVDKDIENHFVFSKDGKIIGIDDKGIMSVRLYTLDRQQLNIARFKIKQNLISNINLIIAALDENKIELEAAERILVLFSQKVIDANQPYNAYTLWARYFNLNFEECFISEIPDKYKPLLRKVYEEATLS